MFRSNTVFFFVSILIVANCKDRAPSHRYPYFVSSSNIKATTSTTTTIKPTTTTLPSTTTINSLMNKIGQRPGPYNIYSGLDFILPMLGNTKPTTSVPTTTPPSRLNPIEAADERIKNSFCFDKYTCPVCPNYGDSICCFKTTKNTNSRGRCRCTNNQIYLNRNCD